MKRVLPLLIWPALIAAQTLPGTRLLPAHGDTAQEMVVGMDQYLKQLTAETRPSQTPSPERLRAMLGVVDPRVPFQNLESVALGETPFYRVSSVRWPVLEGVNASGLHYIPKKPVVMRVVVMSDSPVQARQLASAGCEVLTLQLIDTQSTWSGNPAIGKSTKQPHREWIYRMAFPVGRHIDGYEVQKVLAAVDWFAGRQPNAPIAVYADGEGARIATYAAVLDPRIAHLATQGFSLQNPPLWQQPLYRNVFGILREFDDASFVKLLNPRALVFPFATPPVDDFVLQADMRREVRELVVYTQRLVRESEGWREKLWRDVGPQGVASRFRIDVIGELPGTPVAPDVRSRLHSETPRWTSWEIRMDVRPGVFAHGFLLLPKDLKPGEKRPLVVVQHGLNGRAEVMFEGTPGRERDIYRNFGAQLADLGFIVFSPQHPYVDEFRHLVRLANPLGLTLYSLIRAQNTVLLDWLVTLPQVDADRIGYYGLSYGGKTALRIPPFDPRFKVAVCAGDFNEWIRKLTSVEAPYSYMYTHEYELPEWNMAAVANHAELAMLTAPRAFMVERGHRDNVGVDEWVSYEYAKVRRFYDESGIGDRTAIVFFNGPHRVDGPAAIQFLRKFLGY